MSQHKRTNLTPRHNSFSVCPTMWEKSWSVGDKFMMYWCLGKKYVWTVWHMVRPIAFLNQITTRFKGFFIAIFQNWSKFNIKEFRLWLERWSFFFFKNNLHITPAILTSLSTVLFDFFLVTTPSANFARFDNNEFC